MPDPNDPLERLQAALAGRYRLVRRIGAGGMAEVYLARDLEQDRDVALKLLHPEIADLLGRERFLLEIEVASRLNHPHIVPILHKGTAGDRVFYAMPFAEAGSLRTRLERERQLSRESAIRIAGEVARALGHAHARGVVHRDIKPENILLQDGVAQIADFGIARAAWALGGKRLTEAGLTIGTPSYMSPEQWQGSDVDPRSDLYSLACVTYEMLAGEPPYTGPDAYTIGGQHARAPVPDVRHLRPMVPQSVAEVVTRALAKHPADRYESTEAFAEALHAPDPDSDTRAETVLFFRPSPNPKPIHLLRKAILAAVPLVALVVLLALGPQAARRLFPPAPAHQEWVIVAEFEAPPDDPGLADVGRTLVEASFDRSGTFATVPDAQLKKGFELAGLPDTTRLAADTACEIAERGGVRMVVTGEILSAGGGHAVILQALDPGTKKPRHTEQVNVRGPDEFLEAFDRAAGRLRHAVTRQADWKQREEPVAPVATSSLKAFRLYAQSVRAARHGQPSLALLEEAVGIDASFATAWLNLSSAAMNEKFDVRRSRSALLTALALPDRLSDMDLREAEASLALIDGDPVAALHAYDRMLSIDPDHRVALAGRGYVLGGLRRYEESLDCFRREAALSPFGPDAGNIWNRAVTLWALGRHEEARTVADSVPGSLGTRTSLVDAFWSGHWRETVEIAERIEAEPSILFPQRMYATILGHAAQAALGRTGAAFDALDRADATIRREGAPGAAWVRRYPLVVVSANRRGVGAVLASRDTTLFGLLSRGLYEAAFGNEARARAFLRRATSRDTFELVDFGAVPHLLEAELAARRAEWPRVVELLRHDALQGEYFAIRGAGTAILCWRIADAFERMSRPDSAIVYLERSLPDYGGAEVYVPAVTQSAYARRRLVLLCAKVGRLEDARRHMDALRSQIDAADPDGAALLEEAGGALTAAGVPERKPGT